MDRIKDYLVIEEQFLKSCEINEKKDAKDSENVKDESRRVIERRRMDEIRGMPLIVGTLEEMIDDDHVRISF